MLQHRHQYECDPGRPEKLNKRYKKWSLLFVLLRKIKEKKKKEKTDLCV